MSSDTLERTPRNDWNVGEDVLKFALMPFSWVPATRRERALLSLAAVVVLLVAFLTRSSGIHCDENNYLRLAQHASMGDARIDGKPPLFYVVNYALSHTVGYLFGPFRYWSLAFVYLLLDAAALVWLTLRLPFDRRQRALFFAITLLSPFFLLNATQVMMEAPMLALECFLIGSLLPTAPPAPRWLMPLSLTLLILTKETALPALLALAGALYFWRRERLVSYGKWIAIALLLSKAIRVLCRVRDQWYGGVATLLQITHWPERFAHTADYFQAWLFLVSPLLLIGALLGAVRRFRGSPMAAGFFTAGALTVIGTLLVQLGVVVDFARYLYPQIGIAILCWAALVVALLPTLVPVLVALGMLAQGASFWLPSSAPLAHWPAFIADEMVSSYVTVMTGVPLRAWTLRQQAKQHDLCVLISPYDRLGVEPLRRYFENAFPGARIFEGADRVEFAACAGDKAIVARLADLGAEGCACGEGTYAIRSCVRQPLRVLGPPVVVRSLICLP